MQTSRRGWLAGMAGAPATALLEAGCVGSGGGDSTMSVKMPVAAEPWTVPDLGMAFVWIAPGSFEMGSNDGDKCERPVHQVHISRGFWLGKSPVTQAEYEAVMGSNRSYHKGPRNPVEMVSWNDAVAFCRKFTDRERRASRLPDGCEYRLPTEAEWEYACRAGTTTEYHWGDDANQIGEYAWYERNSQKQAREVGKKKPNAWGLHDMTGNVWEWCQDWYGGYNVDKQTDPKGVAGGSSRVLRGGGWFYSSGGCRSADRDWCSPSYRYDSLGFRLVRAVQ